MKLFRKTFLRLFFLAAVLICLGLNTYIETSTHTYIIEFLGEHTKSGNNLTKHIDSGNHDQITYKYKYCFVKEPACLIQLLQNPSLVSDFSASIWQPPKI